ncbi:MAG: nitroreductase [Actinobacteria bacterium]|nr:MAG: nitroreductase [Actinomycetota bacterium]
MSDDDFFSVVHRQRACREFSERDVPDVLVAQVLDAAVFAPSAENHQPWDFVVVRDANLRARLGDLFKQAWIGGGREFSAPRVPPALLANVDAVCADAERTLNVTVPSSIFPATQNLLLAATALGLGSALTTITTLFADDMRQLLGLPEHLQPVAVVPLGWPAKPLGPPRRDPFADHTHRDRYGTAW